MSAAYAALISAIRRVARWDELRVVAGQVGVVLPGEAAPGDLDLVGRGVDADAQHGMGVLLGHVASVSPPPRLTAPAGTRVMAA